MPRFASEYHPLLAGMVCGALQESGFDAKPELAPDEERSSGDDYLPSCLLTYEGRQWRVSVEPVETERG